MRKGENVWITEFKPALVLSRTESKNTPILCQAQFQTLDKNQLSSPQHPIRVPPGYSKLDIKRFTQSHRGQELGFQLGSQMSERAATLRVLVDCGGTCWLHTLHANSTPSPQMWQPNMSPHTAKCPHRGGTNCPSQDPLLSLGCPRTHFESLWVTRPCVSHTLSQSICVSSTNSPTFSNLGHLQCAATETLCCLRPHITYQSVSPKTCCHPQPCHWDLCSPFPGGVCPLLSTPQGFRVSGPQSSSQRQGPKYTWSQGDQNTEAPHKARWAEESQKQRDSQRSGCREAWPHGATAGDAAWVPGDLSRPYPAHLWIRLRGGEARVPRVRSLDSAWQLIACTRPLSRSPSPEQPPHRTVKPLLLPSGTQMTRSCPW